MTPFPPPLSQPCCRPGCGPAVDMKRHLVHATAAAAIVLATVTVLVFAATPGAAPEGAPDFTLTTTTPPAALPQASLPQRILVLASSTYSNPGVERYTHGVLRELVAQGVARSNVHVEYLDLVRRPDAAYRTALAALLQDKYRGVEFDAVVVVQQAALNFLLGEASALAPGARVLAAYTYIPLLLDQSGRSFLFQMPRLDYGGTLQRALELFPDTRRVVVMTGNSEQELARLPDIRAQLATWRDRLNIELTHERSYADVRRELATAEHGTVVLALGYSRDVAGQSFVPADTIEQVAADGRAPVFTFNESTIGPHVLGGMVAPVDDAAARLARAALNKGTRLKIAQMQGDIVPMFDWSQLQRWQRDPALLPHDTVFRNRPPSLLGQYLPFVAASTLTILVLSLMLAVLMWEIRRRRRAELTMAASEERYRGLVEHAPEAILIFDIAANRVADANLSAQRMLGASRAELASAGWLRFFAPVQPDGRAVQDSVPDDMAQAASGLEVVCERTLMPRDGRIVQCEVRMVDCSEGARRLLRISCIDITERKKQEQLMRKLLAENQTILRNAQVGIAHVRGRRFLSGNRRLEELFGYATGELDNQSVELYYPSRQAFSDAGERIYAQLARGACFSEEMMLRRKDGSAFWGMVTGSAIDPAWPQDGSIWIYTDVSARRAAEQELLRHRAHLEDLVAQRTDELQTARDQAEAANRAKTVFLSNMSHELRTPLNAVIGFSELLANTSMLSEEQRANLAIINRSGAHLLERIDDVLALSKMDTGRQPLDLEAIDPAALLRAASAAQAGRASAAGLALQLDMSGLPPAVLADAGQLRQVLEHLLNNAIRYTQQGAVRMVARGRPLKSGRASIKFSVIDSGIGIAPADQARIFEPFAQMDAGAGLGLPIARQTVQKMGSDLVLHSAPGTGSTFSFTLEFALAPTPAVDVDGMEGVRGVGRVGGIDQGAGRQPLALIAAPPSQLEQATGKRALVADDNPDARLLLRQLLQPLGLDVTEARNGLEAVELAAMLQPELVFMDSRMPGIDGLQATRRIRALHSLRRPHIIMLTASAVEEQEQQALNLGADQFLRKPLEQERLFSALERCFA